MQVVVDSKRRRFMGPLVGLGELSQFGNQSKTLQPDEKVQAGAWKTFRKDSLLMLELAKDSRGRVFEVQECVRSTCVVPRENKNANVRQ